MLKPLLARVAVAVARQAVSADHETHRAFLVCEGVLDMGADGRLLGVGPRVVSGHRLAARLPAVDPADLAEVARYRSFAAER